MSKGHRADIQGLRAVAVLLVALGHAAVGPLPGGFVGVDVFFVISGFLITSLLLTEVARDGRISLAGFYARRARRILPAATLVMLVTVAAALLFLSGIESLEAIDDAIWATFFAANFKFAADGTDYFQAEATPSPLQHYWSLAVEEQFYVVWPLLILVICLVARRFGRNNSITAPAGIVLAILVVASFTWSVIDTQASPVTAYFSPFTRAWELGLGALAACLVPYLAKLRADMLAAFSWVGLVAILWSAMAYDETVPFPGYAAAVPVLGTVLLLIGGLGPARWGPQRLLTLRPMTLVGDWSYSFYLWHWPALIFAASVWGPISGWSGLLVLAGALALSALTYVVVENPFRRIRMISLRPSRGLLLYPAALVLVLPTMGAARNVVETMADGGGPWITTERYGQQQGDPQPEFSRYDEVALVEASLLAARNGMRVPRDLSPSPLAVGDAKPDLGDCEYQYASYEDQLCPMGDPAGSRRLVVVGDSHARQWVPAITALAERYGFQAYYLVHVGCPGADVTPWRGDGTGPNYECAEFQDWAVEQIAELQPDVTIIGSAVNPEGFADDEGNQVTDVDELAELYEDGMRRQVERIDPHSDRVILIGDPPTTTFQVGICLSRRNASLQGCVAEPTDESLITIAAARAGALRAGAEYVDTSRWFCVEDACPPVIGHFVPRRDLQHVTVEYAEFLTDALGRELALQRSASAPDTSG